MNGKRAAAPSPVVRYVRAETAEDRAVDRCTDNHPECMLSAEKLCVHKIRARYPCMLETRTADACPFGDKCHFEHPQTTEKSSTT